MKTEEEHLIEKHYSRLIKYAAGRFPNEEEQEDFVHFSIEKIIVNPSRSSNYEWLYTDYLRQFGGYRRGLHENINGSQAYRKDAVISTTDSFDENYNTKQIADCRDNAIEKLTKLGSDDSIFKAASKGSTNLNIRRAIYFLKNKYGFSAREIADLFDVSEGRISQIYNYEMVNPQIVKNIIEFSKQIKACSLETIEIEEMEF